MSRKKRETNKAKESRTTEDAQQIAKAKLIERVRSDGLDLYQQEADELKELLSKEPEGCIEFIKEVYEALKEQEDNIPRKISLAWNVVAGLLFGAGKLVAIAVWNFVFQPGQDG